MRSAPKPNAHGATKALIALAKQGDKKALNALLKQEEARIYAFGLRMCRNRDDAADVLQETMLAVVKHLGEFRGDAALSTWLFQVARSHCIKKRRRRKGEPQRTDALDSPEVSLRDSSPDPEQTTSARELERLMQEALNELPTAAREVLVLRDVEGLTAPEVARVLGTSVEAVKSKLHRARSGLHRALAPRLREDEAAKPRGCPDVLAMYSQQLEGELSRSLCAKMETHVSSCGHCSDACKTLKENLALCSRLPAVPKEVQQQVRTALREALAEVRK